MRDYKKIVETLTNNNFVIIKNFFTQNTLRIIKSEIKKLEKKDLNKRIKIRNMYIKGLRNIPGLIIPFCNNDNYVSNYIFPVVLDSSDELYRDDIRNKLHQKGIQTSVHYPAVHRFSIYKNDYLDLPNTDYVSNNEITLPMYSSLKKEEISYIIKTLIQILEK